ncbi:hypothetical protein [Shewanella oncorhynchi]|uniref:hypothetical protein n=1 Tax=Shewanella oncorhynchi TaxID=2726434 RepID=UPI003D79A47B
MAEPTKLTQAQALFAVLAGAAQSRRERVYYRDGVLRSTLYSPIVVFNDTANNSVSLGITYFPIVSVPLDFTDSANNSASFFIEKKVTAKPEATELAINYSVLSIQAFIRRSLQIIDYGVNNSNLNIVKYTVARPKADDLAINNTTITVVKL